jgi:signal transduction histidine kinase/DNA-binding NarL/FixJ family response regulator
VNLPPTEEKTSARGQPKATFLVDDQPKVLLALTRSLAQLGHPSESFTRAEDVLLRLEHHPPACVVADYYMPGLDGLELLERVQQRDPAIARVILTGGHVDQRLRRAFEAGTVQILVHKPWNLVTIDAMLDHAASGSSGVVLGGAGEAAEPAGERTPTRPAQVLAVVAGGAAPPELARTLARIGADHRAVAAAEAAATLRAGRFDVVLVDLDVEASLEAVASLVGVEPRAPIIGLSTGADRDRIAAAYRRGISGLLQAPISHRALLDVVQRSSRLGRVMSDFLARPELQAVLEVQHAIADGVEQPVLLDMLQQQMIRLTGAESASVLLFKPGARDLRVAASYGLDEDEVLGQRVAVGERVCGWVAEHNQPQLIVGPGEDDPRLAGVERRHEPSAGLCLPLRGRDSLVGVLCLSRYNSQELFTRDDIEIGLLMGSEVARALEQRAAEEEQQDVERSVMRRDKLVTIGELASGVAHEINNPLGYVRSNINSLKEYFEDLLPLLELLAADPPALDRAADRAREADLPFILEDLPSCFQETSNGIERVLQIVGDLKTFTRDDAESRELADLNQVIEGAVNILWNQIKHKAKLDRDLGRLPQVPCYPSQLGQVFMNLLYNAVQAIDHDGRIRIHTRLEGDWAVAEVGDTGCGMSEEVMAHVFEPFYTTKPRGVGTGLGLSIARKIIERHGGRMSVSSILGEGTTFRLSLPLKVEREAE